MNKCGKSIKKTTEKLYKVSRKMERCKYQKQRFNFIQLSFMKAFLFDIKSDNHYVVRIGI